MNSNSPVSWNVKAGMNISNWSGEGTDGTDAKVGYKLGVGMEYAFDKIWSLQPSLFLSSKGVKESGEVDNVSGKITVNQVYLELPVNIQARLSVSDKTNIVFAGGPYMAYGVGGKMTVKASSGGSSVSVDTDTFGDGALKRFDAGLGVGVALEFDKFIVGLDGQVGLAKLSDGSGSPKNTNFSITVGYKF